MQKQDAYPGRRRQAKGGPRDPIRMTYSPPSTLQRYVPVDGGAHPPQGLGTSELMVRRITGPGLLWNAEESSRGRAIRNSRSGRGSDEAVDRDRRRRPACIWLVCLCFLLQRASPTRTGCREAARSLGKHRIWQTTTYTAATTRVGHEPVSFARDGRRGTTWREIFFISLI